MSLFKVHATQEQEMVFFVEAPDFETAKADANELVGSSDPSDWVYIDTSVLTYQARADAPGDLDEVWTGGPDGEFISGDMFKGRQ